MPSGQIDSVAGGAVLRYPSETIEQVALRELSEEAGYELAKDGELIALGYYFSSPGFTDERGYFFVARPVQRCKEPQAREEAESILDCREFTVEQIRRMIAENELRDAVSARSSVARAALILPSNGAARHLQISRSAGERNFQAVSRALGRLAMDHCEGGDHARGRDDRLLPVSLDTRASTAGAAARCWFTDRDP